MDSKTEQKYISAGFYRVEEQVTEIIAYKKLDLNGVIVDAKGVFYTEKSRVDPKYIGKCDLDGLKVGDTELYFLLGDDQLESLSLSLFNAQPARGSNAVAESPKITEALEIGNTTVGLDYRTYAGRPATKTEPEEESSFNIESVYAYENNNPIDVTAALDDDSLFLIQDMALDVLNKREDPSADRKVGFRP